MPEHSVIWKFNPDDQEHFEAPVGARFLHCAEQAGVIRVWGSCDPTQPTKYYWLKLVCTGETTNFAGIYVGTLLLQGGSLVLHAFVIETDW